MKIQNLAVIFIIIILPISMVLTVYVQNQVKTLELQISYDTKLTNATYDAIKAFQLNTANSDTSDLANSKLRDIEASVNTFYNSISTQFNMAGYNEDILKDYVPALVYTMYDGFYIYSEYTNTILDEDQGETYKNGDKIAGLKPYIHYSCRYKTTTSGIDIDVVITYSLDNYITVQGTINEKPVYKYGYLLDNIEGSYNGDVNNPSYISYRGVQIQTEHLEEENITVTDDNTVKTKDYTYTKINGVKYYTDGNAANNWYSILNGKVLDQGEKYKTTNDAGLRYYQEAKEFTEWVDANLSDLRPSDAVDEDGNRKINEITNDEGEKIASAFDTNDRIFGRDSTTSIEDPNSNFNQHRLAVIRYVIERNLSIAIANYNNYTGVTTEFRMPELKETEWEKILNNVSLISFMQGLSIGGKIYNGYAIVTNTKTEEVVNTDSIYITTADGQYHRVTDAELLNDAYMSATSITGAYLNTDFERKSITPQDLSTQYFFPQTESACYSSIVNQTGLNDTDNIYKYIEDINTRGETSKTLAEKYFTALGRERYSMYKTNNNSADIKANFIDETYSGEI